MITVRIIKNGYGHKEGQVFPCSEFEASHLIAFGYAVPAVEKKPERRPIVPPETRIENLKTNHIPMPNIQTEVTPNQIEIKVDELKNKKQLKGIFSRTRKIKSKK